MTRWQDPRFYDVAESPTAGELGAGKLAPAPKKKPATRKRKRATTAKKKTAAKP